MFVKLSKSIDKFKKRSRYGDAFYVLLVILVTALISYPVNLTRMSNVVFVSELFKECPKDKAITGGYLCEDSSTLLFTLLWSLLVKAFLMIITFGLRIPGGFFIPSMAVGSCFGRLVGLLIQNMLESWGHDRNLVIPAVYAMVGASATLSGVTRMTVSLSVIMFELTGGLTYVLPVMCSIMTAKWVADAFGRDSIYDSLIRDKGYPYLNHKRTNLPRQSSASDIMETDVETIDVDAIYRIGDLELKLNRLCRAHPSLDGGLPVLKDGTILIGYISQNDLKHAIELVYQCSSDQSQSIVFHDLSFVQNIYHESPRILSPIYQINTPNGTVSDLSQWIDKAPLTIQASASCEMVVELFIKLGIRSLIVVREGVFLGILHKKRILSFLSNMHPLSDD
jgi:chloride channel 3/4/5